MNNLIFSTASRNICQFCKKCLLAKNEYQLLKSQSLLSKFTFNHQQPFSNSVEKDVSSDEPVTYEVSHEDFKWVRKILPPSVVPDPPKHAKYPTPSGWLPPSDTVPDLPYFIPRTRFHTLPVFWLAPKIIVPFTKISKIEGDIWALQKDLIDLVRPHCEFEPATRVHEVAMQIFIKGDYTDLVRDFLYKQGF